MARKADEEGLHDLAEQFWGVVAIEKAHEERYRALLKNVEAKTVFEKAGAPLSNYFWITAFPAGGCDGGGGLS